MPNISEINGYGINAESASYAATASLLLGSVVSASYAATASYSTTLGAAFSNTSDGTLRLINSANTTISSVLVTASLALRVSGSLTGSLLGTATTASYVLQAVSASYALTASYAANGGVTQLLAGPNISISPTTGVGQVTISSTGGGSSFNTATGSYGSFYSTQTQTNVASTARSMSLNTTDISNGVSISGSTNPYNTYIKVENAGVYDIQFSAQVDKTDSGTDEIWIWLRKNGSDVSDSATSLQLVGNGAHYVAAWNFFVNAAANDYFQLMWYSPDANVRLHAEPAFGVVPGIPSLIVTANRVDQFLSNTGSFSGSFTGSLLGTIGVVNVGGAAGIMYPLIGSAFSGDATVYTIDTPDYKYDVTNNQLIVSSVSGSFTGSLFGTASFATVAQTLLGSVTSASFALTASSAPNAALSIFGNFAGAGFANPIVTHLPFGTTTVSGNESQRQIVTPMGGTLKNLYIRTNGTAAVGGFTTFIIRVNGVATNVQINISGGQAAGLYSNIINSASVTLGDQISLQVSTSIANGPGVNQYSFGIFNT